MSAGKRVVVVAVIALLGLSGTLVTGWRLHKSRSIQLHFRPPYGKRRIGLPWYLDRTNRTTVLWTLEPDTRYRTAADKTRQVLDGIRPGSIILLHVESPGRQEERAALPRIIEGLRARGYRFVTVSQLLAHGSSDE